MVSGQVLLRLPPLFSLQGSRLSLGYLFRLNPLFLIYSLVLSTLLGYYFIPCSITPWRLRNSALTSNYDVTPPWWFFVCHRYRPDLRSIQQHYTLHIIASLSLFFQSFHASQTHSISLSYIQHIEGVNTVGSKFAFHSLGFDRRRHFLLSESLMNDIAFVGRGCWRGAS